MEQYNPQDLKSVLAYMRKEYGADIFQQSSRMYEIFCELSPSLKPYGNVIRQLAENGALEELETALMNTRRVLKNDLLLNAERANYVLGALCAMYGVATVSAQSKAKQSATKKPSAKRVQWGECGGGGYSIRYNRYDNGVMTLSGKGPMRDFESRDGYRVPWRNQCNTFSCVEIYSGVTSIGAWAFRACAELKSVVIPDSVTRIGRYAFAGCAKLTSITIPDSVTTIGACAFASCKGLESVTIPDSVSYIGDWAFNGCVNLKSASVPAKAAIASGSFPAFPDWTRIERRKSVSRPQENL